MKLITGIFLAFLLDLVIGDPYHFPHPVRLIGTWITVFEKKVLTQKQSSIRKKIEGLFLWMTTLGLTFFVTYEICWIAGQIHELIGFFVQTYLLYTCFSVKGLAVEARKIYQLLNQQNIEQARHALSMIVGRETQRLNEAEITRAVVETVAENVVDGFISPLFFAVLGGAPLAMTFKAVNTLDSMVGYRNETYQDFGFVSAKFDDLANYIPARLSLFLISFAALLLDMPAHKALQIGLRDRKKHASPNAGYPEAAVAGALEVELGGANWYFGKKMIKPTLGDPTKPLDKQTILDAIGLLYSTAWVSLFVFLIIPFIIQLR